MAMPIPRPPAPHGSRRQLLRGMMIAAPVSLLLWGAIGVAAIDALPTHSRPALKWRLHYAARVVGQFGRHLA